MSEIITRGANLIRLGTVHGAARRLRAYSATTDWTAEGQDTLCRPGRAFGRYGAGLTTNAITCANCLRIIAKAEREAYAEANDRRVRASFTPEAREAAYQQAVAEDALAKSERITRTLRTGYPVGLRGQELRDAQAEAAQWSNWYRRTDGADMTRPAAERIEADHAEALAENRTRTVTGRVDILGQMTDAIYRLNPAHSPVQRQAALVQLDRWVSARSVASTFTTGMLHRLELDHEEALEANARHLSLGNFELTETGKAKVAALGAYNAQILAWHKRHAATGVHTGPLGAWAPLIEADHVFALVEDVARDMMGADKYEANKQVVAWVYANGAFWGPDYHAERAAAIERNHAEALEIQHWLDMLAAYSWVPRSAVLRITTNSTPEQRPSIADNLRASGSVSNRDERREAAHAEALAEYDARERRAWDDAYAADKAARRYQEAEWRQRHNATGQTLSVQLIEADHAEALELNAAINHEAQVSAWWDSHSGHGHAMHDPRAMIACDVRQAYQLAAEMTYGEEDVPGEKHAPNAITAIWNVVYTWDGDETVGWQTTVALTAGYTTEADIPAILATSRTGRPADADKVRIVRKWLES